MSFIVVVETAYVNRGIVTNSHSKHAVKSPNKLLKGRRACIAKTKKQTVNQDQSLTKSSKSTHLTPMHEVDTFGDLGRISLTPKAL
jgi:hypothetical protein